MRGKRGKKQEDEDKDKEEKEEKEEESFAGLSMLQSVLKTLFLIVKFEVDKKGVDQDTILMVYLSTLVPLLLYDLFPENFDDEALKRPVRLCYLFVANSINLQQNIFDPNL